MKKLNVSYIVIFAVIILFIVIAVILNTLKQNGIKPSNSQISKLSISVWSEDIKQKKGYIITENQKYTSNGITLQKGLNPLRENNSIIDFVMDSIQKQIKVNEYFSTLKKYGITVKPSALQNISAYANGFNLIPTEETGTISISTKESKIDVIYYGIEYMDMASEDGKTNYSQFVSIINQYRSVFGAPQATYYDKTYENIRKSKEDLTIDFYFDKGIAFARNHIIFFRSSKTVDQELMSHIGLEYLRGQLGCEPYCIR